MMYALLLNFCFITAEGAEECKSSRDDFPVHVQCMMMLPRAMAMTGQALASQGAMITRYTIRCEPFTPPKEGEDG